MKKWTAILSGVAVATLFLSGCSTSSNDDGNDSSNVANTSENQNNTTQNDKSNEVGKDSPKVNTNEKQSEETTAEPKEVTSNEDASKVDATNNQTSPSQNESSNDKSTEEQKNHVQVMEKNLQYVINGESKEETAVLKKSDDQPFSLYVLPKFELSAEEPGKDIVYASANEEIFMRIELLEKDTDLAAIEDNMKAQLKATSDSITNPGLNIGKGVQYEVTKDNDVVTAVLLEDTETPVRLTMFTTKDTDYRDAFLQMAKTITKQ